MIEYLMQINWYNSVVFTCAWHVAGNHHVEACKPVSILPTGLQEQWWLNQNACHSKIPGFVIQKHCFRRLSNQSSCYLLYSLIPFESWQVHDLVCPKIDQQALKKLALLTTTVCHSARFILLADCMWSTQGHILRFVAVPCAPICCRYGY